MVDRMARLPPLGKAVGRAVGVVVLAVLLVAAGSGVLFSWRVSFVPFPLFFLVQSGAIGWGVVVLVMCDLD